MSESDRHKRPGERADSGRPDWRGPARGEPRGGKPPRHGGGSRPSRDGRPERGGREQRPSEQFEDRDPYNIRSVRNRHDDPEIPRDVKPDQLDRVARAQLKTLAKENADVVAMHLVMAAQLINDDPELAHRHATSAARRAGRIAVVRETLAITAYAVGDFALTLRELRTYRRISGRDDQLPMMVDSERGLGRPDRALELGRSVPRESLPVDVQVELAIAMSGARLDLGQTDAALLELEIPQLDPHRAYSWSPALFSAYAAVLEDLGRGEEAASWYRRADVAAEALHTSSSSGDEDVIEVFEEEIDEVHDDTVERDGARADSDSDER